MREAFFDTNCNWTLKAWRHCIWCASVEACLKVKKDIEVNLPDPKLAYLAKWSNARWVYNCCWSRKCSCGKYQY